MGTAYGSLPPRYAIHQHHTASIYGHSAQERVHLHLLLQPNCNPEDGRGRYLTYSQRYTGRGCHVGRNYLFYVAGGSRLDMRLPAILYPVYIESTSARQNSPARISCFCSLSHRSGYGGFVHRINLVRGLLGFIPNTAPHPKGPRSSDKAQQRPKI